MLDRRPQGCPGTARPAADQDRPALLLVVDLDEIVEGACRLAGAERRDEIYGVDADDERDIVGGR